MRREAPLGFADSGFRSLACPQSRSLLWPSDQQGSVMTRWSPRATRRLSPMCPSIAPRRSMSSVRGRRAQQKRAAGGSPRHPRPTRGGWPRSSKAQCLATPPCSTSQGAIGSRRSRRPSRTRNRSNLPRSMRLRRDKAGVRPRSERSSSCKFALHYSRRSAALAMDLASAGGAAAHFRLMTHVCLSDDVAEPLIASGTASVHVAARPDEAALLATLRQAAAVFSSQDPSRI